MKYETDNANLVEKLFAESVDQTPEQRHHYIKAARYPDHVKQAAMRLVKAYESESELLNNDLVSDVARIDPQFFDASENDGEVALTKGDRINGFAIDTKIGEGGMSIVYRAIQSKPIKRAVALKVIRPSLFAPRTVLRFFREQQALALVGHPHIATLYEVGSTDDGHPYAAMELVKGVPITAFCEKLKMESRQRIILFLYVCDALKHAHRNGVVHRDVKPGNILVGIRNRKPIPKLIDFGIAKITNKDYPAEQTMTRKGQLLGSPRYMSPEQFSSSEIDARSDIYSAALVLFELLARTPYRDGDETTEELMARAKQPVPERLSTRMKQNVRTMGMASFDAESTAAFVKFTKRDLDWILSKALARDPGDRYASMDAFMKDLKATLRGQPVSVSPPGFATRAKQFANANRKMILAAAASLLLLLSMFGIYKWQTSENQIAQFQQATTTSENQTAAANELIMKLLASDMYELTIENFDLKLIPFYEQQYESIKADGGPQNDEQRTVYGILAVLYAMSGDFDQSDVLMAEVTDDQQRDELRLVREKICSEYAATAKEELARLDESQASERALQQMTLGRCYIVWNMLDDGKQLLNDATRYFDEKEAGSYNALVARITLIRILKQAGEADNHLSLLTKTYEDFKTQDELRATKRGAEAFKRVCNDLAEADPENFATLKE